MAILRTPDDKGEGPIKRDGHLLGYAGEMFLGDLFLNITGVLIVALGITLFAIKTQRYEQAMIKEAPLSFLVCSDFIEARSSGERINPSLLLDSTFADALLAKKTADRPVVLFLGDDSDTASFFLSAYLARHGVVEASIIEGQCPIQPKAGGV